MTQPTLLQLPGATEGTTQWKAETLQMVNWGGFQGHAQMSIAPTTTLLSGASGTGKSTALDAYLALMMPSDTPFNGASNDATTGRARGADQRSLVTYLRGKVDSARETGTGELTDHVLRGRDSATWGALAMTFVDDHGRRFTALRAYFVPQGASRFAEITMKMATIADRLDLRELEPLAASKFDKRLMKVRWPDMAVHDTYTGFSSTLFTRLGIGVGGDGSKALRLLARLQGGQQVRTVDGLYKSMVLEEPPTYAAADRAISHFTDLEAAYEAMRTEAAKAKALRRLPELHQQRVDARATEDLLTTMGFQRAGDSPFLVWRLRTESGLLDAATTGNRERRRAVAAASAGARQDASRLERQAGDVREQLKTNGGDRLEQLKRDLEELATRRGHVVNRRAKFDESAARLGIAVGTAADFDRHRAAAETFLAAFDAKHSRITAQRDTLKETAYPLTRHRDELREEHQSLKGRTGLVPKRLHDARVAIAAAAGIDPAELPFVAELIDIARGEEQWRTAAEVTLFAVARIMLVDRDRLEQLSAAIDPVRIPTRVTFEGVQLRPFTDSPGDPHRIGGKLRFQDSPFTAWVQDRVRQQGTNALCVDDPRNLGGGGPRVTRAGQTRNGTRGAHGDVGDRPIIGFSNAERLVQIEHELHTLDTRLGDLLREEQVLEAARGTLVSNSQGHQFVLATLWDDIDVAAVDDQIRGREAERGRILAASDVLRALQAKEQALQVELEDARRVRYGADKEVEDLDKAYDALVRRGDRATAELERLASVEAAQLTARQAEHLDDGFAAVGSATADLTEFESGIDRLRTRLGEESQAAHASEQAAARTLCGIFDAFQGQWPDPNLGVAIESYSSYRDILDAITSTGLHERREEWLRRLSEWSGQDLVPLHGAFSSAIEDIEDRLLPVNAILAELPFGPGRDRLRIVLRRLTLDNITKFRHELKALSSGVTQNLPDDQVEARFTRLKAFIALIRTADSGAKGGPSTRDAYLDVRRHVEITAARVNTAGVNLATYASLGGKSGGETQELVAFIVGAALRFQLGDEDRARPRFAPIFLDEGFVKSDSEFAGRAVNAWKGLGFQLIVGAPLDKVTALEPDMELVLTITKSSEGYSHIVELNPETQRPEAQRP